MKKHTMEDLVSLCKRRGFIFQSNEIYGGLQGLYDYGPLGVELKNNLKKSWWHSMIYERDDIEGIDSSILTNPLVLKYSGHEDTFSDPLQIAEIVTRDGGPIILKKENAPIADRKI